MLFVSSAAKKLWFPDLLISAKSIQFSGFSFASFSFASFSFASFSFALSSATSNVLNAGSRSAFQDFSKFMSLTCTLYDQRAKSQEQPINCAHHSDWDFFLADLESRFWTPRLAVQVERLRRLTSKKIFEGLNEFLLAIEPLKLRFSNWAAQ